MGDMQMLTFQEGRENVSELSRFQWKGTVRPEGGDKSKEGSLVQKSTSSERPPARWESLGMGNLWTAAWVSNLLAPEEDGTWRKAARRGAFSEQGYRKCFVTMVYIDVIHVLDKIHE